MGTITRSHSFISSEKPTEDEWNVDIDQLFSLINGNLDKANVDSSSSDGVVTMDETQTITGRKTFSGNIASDVVIDTVAAAAGSVQDLLTLEWNPSNDSNLTDNASGVALNFSMPDDSDAQHDFGQIACLVVSDAAGSEEGELSFRATKAGTDDVELLTLAPTTGLTLGVAGTGYDVVFHSATSGDNLTWDASEEVLQITGTNGQTSLDVLDGDVRIVDKLYLYDRGGEYLSSDGSTLTITGAVSTSSTFATTGAATLASLVCTAGATFGGGIGDTGVTISTAGVIQANGAITSDGAVTGATLAGTVSTATQNSITTATSLASVGTITSGTWNADVIASAKLDSDTAHLGVTQTFTGAKTFGAAVTVGANDQGYDVIIYGDTASSNLTWDTSEDDLVFNNAGIAVGSDATGDVYYRDSSGFLERIAIGTDGQVLTSTGAVPQWEAAASGVSFSGSTANGIATYGSSSSAIVESNLKFDGNTLTIADGNNDGNKSIYFDQGVGANYGWSFDIGALSVWHILRHSNDATGVSALGIARDNGNVFLNDNVNTNITAGLTINQGSANKHVLTFKQSAVNHAFTTTSGPAGTNYAAETDDFASFSMISTDAGGLHIQSIAEESPGRALLISSHGGTSVTTKANSADCLITLFAGEHDGSGTSRVVTADGCVLGVGAKRTDGSGNKIVFIVDEDGNLFSDESATVGVMDHEPDALLMRAGRHGLLNGGSPLWLDADPVEVRRMQDVLEEHKVIFWNRKEDGGDGGAPFICHNRAIMVAWDGLYQAHGEREELREELAELRQQNIQLASRLNLLEN